MFIKSVEFYTRAKQGGGLATLWLHCLLFEEKDSCLWRLVFPPLTDSVQPFQGLEGATEGWLAKECTFFLLFLCNFSLPNAICSPFLLNLLWFNSYFFYMLIHSLLKQPVFLCYHRNDSMQNCSFMGIIQKSFSVWVVVAIEGRWNNSLDRINEVQGWAVLPQWAVYFSRHF